MKLKRYKIPTPLFDDSGKSGIMSIETPEDGWVLDFDYELHNIYANIITNGGKLKKKNIYVTQLICGIEEVNISEDIDLDDLIFLGSCVNQINRDKYFIFGVSPREN